MVRSVRLLRAAAVVQSCPGPFDLLRLFAAHPARAGRLGRPASARECAGRNLWCYGKLFDRPSKAPNLLPGLVGGLGRSVRGDEAGQGASERLGRPRWPPRDLVGAVDPVGLVWLNPADLAWSILSDRRF